MTNEFKITNCILAAMLLLILCTYLVLMQCIQKDNVNMNRPIQTVAAFNA